MSFTESVADIVQANTNGLLAKHSSWGRVPLRDVFYVQNGFPFESKYFNACGDGKPLLRIRDIVSGTTETFYSGPYDDEFIVKPGDIVVGMDGDFNIRAWRGPEALLNQRVCRLAPRGGYLQELLPWVLQGYLNAINASTSAITVKHLSSRTVEEIPLPLPPASEQGRLLESLESEMSRLDAAETSLQYVRGRLQAYRASVLKAAVEGRLVPTEAELARKEGREYEAASVLLDRILKERRHRWEENELARLMKAGKAPKDDRWKKKYEEPEAPDTRKLSELPQGWCWASIEQLSLRVFYGTSAKTSQDGEVPVLRMGNIIDGVLDLADLKYLPADHPEFPELFLKRGDLLFNRTNSAELVGKTAVYRGHPPTASFASYLIGARLLVDAGWVSHVINSPYGRHWASDVAVQQVGQANINGSKLKALAVPLPPLAEFDRILSQVDRAHSSSQNVMTTLQREQLRVARLRQGILKWAFEGKLVDQDPADEPAGRLLARIRAARATTTTIKKSKNGKERLAG
ncbi:restriction endonuclease subunit S [Anaeromyxobacter soli]|uniref:restriction endonuclease subunit S n=1 Tax=Anaeromyxobacter soli TaxID=2922725 RepID=UPI001FAEFBC4|nr:restriction endonuclease subunit S [Anaeromyxobacter sp. SG29]